MTSKKLIPILGRVNHAISMKYQVDNIITRLYIAQENQFQIINKEKVPSLKRAFKDCSSFAPQQLEDLALKEIKMALSYTFDTFDISAKVELIEKNDYRLIISGTVTSDDGKETYSLNHLISFDGSSFTRLLGILEGKDK